MEIMTTQKPYLWHTLLIFFLVTILSLSSIITGPSLVVVASAQESNTNDSFMEGKDHYCHIR